MAGLQLELLKFWKLWKLFDIIMLCFQDHIITQLQSIGEETVSIQAQRGLQKLQIEHFDKPCRAV